MNKFYLKFEFNYGTNYKYFILLCVSKSRAASPSDVYSLYVAVIHLSFDFYPVHANVPKYW